VVNISSESLKELEEAGITFGKGICLLVDGNLTAGVPLTAEQLEKLYEAVKADAELYDMEDEYQSSCYAGRVRQALSIAMELGDERMVCRLEALL